MKNITLLFLFLFVSSASSRELMNFYLSPNTFTSQPSISLHTTFSHPMGAGLSGFEYTIEGNTINASMCYITGSTTVLTLDQQVFEIMLPGEGDYILNLELISSFDNTPCTTIIDTGVKSFSYPYYPNETISVPDDAFEKYFEDLKFGDDSLNNNLVPLHKVENITALYLVDYYISVDDIFDLTGLKYIKSLKKLWSDNNLISQLNLDYNIKLEELRFTGSLIESIDLSNNTSLIRLTCNSTNLSYLNVSNNLPLEYLSFSGNGITNINLDNNINLEYLSIGGTQLSTLNLNNNTLLEEFNISNNLLTNLDLSSNTNLHSLSINNSQLSSLDLSNNSLLTDIELNENELLTSINIDNLTLIENITCINNQITDFDLSLNTNLFNVFLFNNNLSSLNIKNGFNENIDLVFTMLNPNLFCIEVDSIDSPQPFGYQIDSQTEFSEDCSIPFQETYNTVGNFEKISIFPNPAKDIIIIDSIEDFFTIKIVDLQGNILITASNSKKIDVSKLPFGVYFLQLTSNENTCTKRFIKK